MRLSQNLNDALNQQIMIELANQNKYMQMQSYFEELQLKKIADYFKSQADGEKDHANLFMNHINDRTGGKVILGEIFAPRVDFASIEQVADYFIQVEEETTNSIEELYGLAMSEGSYIDLPFLQTMLNEQVEEESSALEFSVKIKMVKDLVLFNETFEK